MKNKFVIVTISTKKQNINGIIEKMEKNLAFSNKLGIKNTSEYLSEKEQKK